MKEYRITGIALMILVATAALGGYVYSEWLNEKGADGKVMFYEEEIGPTGVIDKSEVTVKSGNILIKEEGIVPFYIGNDKSMSMLPFMDSKTTILATKNFKYNGLKVGDIIVFRDNGDNVAHTIMRIAEDEEGKYLLTRGYNNYWLDNIKHREGGVDYLVTGVLYGE